MSKLLGPLLVAGAAALVSYYGALWLTPRAIMSTAIDRVGEAGVNVMHHGDLANASSRAIVRPSPDLAYSSCAFDLSTGPVRIDAPIPPGRYWSLSVFDRNTDNVFSVNDREAKAARYSLVLSADGKATGGDQSLVVPGGKGIALVRILVKSREDFASINALRRQASCVAVTG